MKEGVNSVRFTCSTEKPVIKSFLSCFNHVRYFCIAIPNWPPYVKAQHWQFIQAHKNTPSRLSAGPAEAARVIFPLPGSPWVRGVYIEVCHVYGCVIILMLKALRVGENLQKAILPSWWINAPTPCSTGLLILFCSHRSSPPFIASRLSCISDLSCCTTW